MRTLAPLSLSSTSAPGYSCCRSYCCLLLVSCSPQGEARALLAAKAVALGEVLPPLHVVCYDAQGNEVPPAALAAAGAGGAAGSGSTAGSAGGAGGGDAGGCNWWQPGCSSIPLPNLAS